MTEFTPLLLRHLVASGLGVGVLALLALALRLLVLRDAVLRYRVMVGALLVGIALLPLQLGVAEFAGPRPEPRPAPRSVAVVVESAEAHSLAALPAVQPPERGAPRLEGADRRDDSAREWPRAAMLLGIYLLGASVVLATHARAALAARRLLARARPVTEARVLALWAPLLGAMKTPPLLLECDALRTPACRVLGRAAVILPAPTTLLDDETLRVSLRHELVHIARRDGIVVLLAAAAQTVFWFQPLVWALTRALCVDREQSCDALVVRATGGARSYAQTLLRFCESTASRRAPAPLIGFESSHSLRRRITMLTHALQPANRSRRAALLAAGLASVTATFAAHGFITTAVAPGSLLPGENAPSTRASVEVRAPAEGRSELNVYERVMQLQRAKEQAGGPGGLVLSQPSNQDWLVATLTGTTPRVEYPAGTWVTDEEPIMTAKNARIEDGSLHSHALRMRLPGGSNLRATFEGSVVRVEKGEDQQDRVRVTGGTVSIVDDIGVTRVQVRADRDDATIVWSRPADAPAGTFELTTDDAATDLSARIDSATGAPEHEKQAPHGAVRWKLIAPLSGDGVTDLRMQWTYDVSQVKNPVGC